MHHITSARPLDRSGLKTRSARRWKRELDAKFADAANEKWYVTYASVTRPDRRLSITRNKHEVYLHFMARAVSRGANRRNFARITCTPRAMALLSAGCRRIARRRSIIRTIACIQDARLKKKLPLPPQRIGNKTQDERAPYLLSQNVLFGAQRSDCHE